MTTVTKATLGRNLPKYIAGVIKYNCTDFGDRVYKSNVEKQEANDKLPACVIDITTSGFKKLGIEATKNRAVPCLLRIDVWAQDIKTRDILSDLIQTTLMNPYATDGEYTLAQNYLQCNGVSAIVADRWMENYHKLIRVMTITADMRYYGA